MSTSAPQRTLEPGLHVRTDESPQQLAVTLASEFDGQLCVTAHEAEVVLAEMSAWPPLTVEAVDELEGLTARLASAQRIVDRTLERAAREVGERLAAVGTGMAIHPSAVRDRAAAVVVAREAVEAAEEQLRAKEAELEAAADEPDPVPAAVTPEAGPAPSKVTGWRRLFGFLRRDRTDEGVAQASSLLQQVAATTDEMFGARRAVAAREDQLALASAHRDRLQEELRVAERAWHDLAGDDSVEDVEAVVRRFDPQHQDALDAAQETVGVRAAMTLLERARERWDEGWRSFGFDPPASTEPAALDSMVTRMTRTIVLVGAAVDKAEVLALAAPAAAVVAVEPA